MLPSSVIRQKGESQIGGNKKAKDAKVSEKQTFLAPLIRTRTYAQWLLTQKISGKHSLPAFSSQVPILNYFQ